MLLVHLGGYKSQTSGVEIMIVNPEVGSLIYIVKVEFEIDANSGTILEWSEERD